MDYKLKEDMMFGDTLVKKGSVINVAADSDTFELTDAKNFSKKEATKIVNDHYYDKLTYKGTEFFDKIYMGTIIPAAEKYLNIGKIDGQESYLGYLPDKDIFVSGWDTWPAEGYDEDEEDYNYTLNDYEVGNVAFIKVNETNAHPLPEYQNDFSYLDNIYMDTYNKIHRLYPNIIDIRLD